MEWSWNYERQSNMSYSFAMIPIINKLYKTTKDKSDALKRHLEFFNTTPHISTLMLGISTAMEEINAKSDGFDTSSINNVKVGLMGPLAGIGDSFFWGTLRVIATGIGTSLALQGNILGPILFLLVFTIVLNILFTPGTPIITFWIIKITKEGLITGGFLTFRLTFLVLSTSVLTLTTTPNDLSDGLEKSFAFLNKIHFPVHEMAMMMSLALRFIPTLVEETEKIKKAQMARGADFETGGLMQRVKSLIPLLVPLFVSSIRRALDLAMAMESRCYHGGNRTKLIPLVYKKKDKISYLVLVVFLCVILGAGFVTNNLVMFKFLSIKAS